MFGLVALLPLLSLAFTAHATISQKDFTGIGNIAVLASSDWTTATPKQVVGCLDDHGRFVKNDSAEACGVFSRLADYPYTLSTKEGNCTFDDETQPRNTDSIYGQNDYAWSCTTGVKTQIYDELYTIDGFPYVFLCFGDVACYYDAKSIPSDNDANPLWQFHWGSQQIGITPGHIQMQLMWEKLGELPKREGTMDIPGPRIEIHEGMQVPLQGKQTRA